MWVHTLYCNKKQLLMTLPAQLLRTHGWRPRDHVAIQLDELGRLIITPLHLLHKLDAETATHHETKPVPTSPTRRNR